MRRHARGSTKTSVGRSQWDDTQWRACMGRNVPPEKTFSTQAHVWVVVVVWVVTALRCNEKMIFRCWPFSIQGTFTPCKLTLGHNEIDSNTYIRVISFPSRYSSLKTIWRRSSSANIWLWFLPSSKTPLKQSQVIIILNKSQGQEYDTAYIKGENLFPAYTMTCTSWQSKKKNKVTHRAL